MGDLLEMAESRLYHRHARLLLSLLSREGVYVVNSADQVFGFRELGRQFSEILRRVENDHCKGLWKIGPESFDELNLDGQLIRDHFSRRAENFIATTAEGRVLYLFFIGDVAVPYWLLVYLHRDSVDTPAQRPRPA